MQRITRKCTAAVAEPAGMAPSGGSRRCQCLETQLTVHCCLLCCIAHCIALAAASTQSPEACNFWQRQAMAVPADLSDPYLKKWVKPQTNPFLFQVCLQQLQPPSQHSAAQGALYGAEHCSFEREAACASGRACCSACCQHTTALVVALTTPPACRSHPAAPTSRSGTQLKAVTRFMMPSPAARTPGHCPNRPTPLPLVCKHSAWVVPQSLLHLSCLAPGLSKGASTTNLPLSPR